MSDSDLTLDELYAHANEMCRKHWGVNFTGRIELTSAKWPGTNGYLRIRLDGSVPPIIRMSRARNRQRSREKVLGTLLHELVHWRMYTTGRPHHDTDRGFVEECAKVGAPISGHKNAQAAAARYLPKEASAQ